MEENRLFQHTNQVYWDGCGLDNVYSGIGRYAFSLYSSLVELGVQPLLLVGRDPVYILKNIGTRCLILKKKSLPVFFKTFYSYFYLKRSLGEIVANKRIFHAHANFNLPTLKNFSNKQKYVLTVHDFIPIILKKDVSSSLYLQFKYLFPRAADKADLLICVSNWTRDCLVDFFPAYSAKQKLLLMVLNPFKV